MIKKTFSVTIDAPREIVWEQLWGKESYPVWTAPFAPGSNVETDWKKGSKAKFIDDKNQGMVSVINDNIPNEYMSIKHLGYIKDGVEDLDSPEVKKWSGSEENYTLKTVNGQTALTVELDLPEDFGNHFDEPFPAALNELKKLSEEK
ncbi:SRPBCC domain-containing protein [Chitinophaga sp. SYP-B3965]|uniref:SRPBCC domain-containing protein n=1 Tax=Chitinophaga sp. SYP-B3965 TaxID=2663120 RepID=UPI001299541F|nr:SRPBCC domain-containing protein [Chitinophaga sp. SYP-B3965]MRG46619.1 SRPBCC domain-containing protein [Chitinophaga sp. SYP-B3965]